MESAALILPRRPLGRTGLESSRLGLSGSWGIDAASVERAFHELGLNHFYFSGRMSGLVAGVRRLIAAGERDRIVLHSAGTYWPTGASVRRTWESHARELGVEVIDIFMVAAVRARWFLGGRTWPAMQRLKEEGKVRALAFSCHNRPLALELARALTPDVLMLRYNAAHPGAEREVFAPLGQGRPAIIAYTATRWGRLLRTAGGLGPMTAPECYRFQLSHPAVDVGLCGAATFDELRQDAAAVAAGPLPQAELARMRVFGEAVHATVRGRIF